MKSKRYKCFVVICSVFMAIMMFGFFMKSRESKSVLEENATTESETGETGENTQNDKNEMEQTEDDFIKWVDFGVTYAALEAAYTYDVDSYGSEIKLDWIQLLAYAACKNWGDFSNDQKVKESMASMAEQLTNKEKTVEELTGDLSNYNYFYESYSAALSGLVGEYELDGTKKYGLKGYSPIAKNFYYTDYDDFGVSRSYGYKRRHLGHDMMGQVGTPIIAVESGIVEVLGWNQYGGWRIGIRSFDGKRYYYYAHLRKDFPYNKSLTEGSIVTAGDVIGYLGRTGYSANENVNNIDEYHLHFGIQLIFDESQKEGYGEIWIDPYNLVRFLYRNRSETQKNEETKEWSRINVMIDPLAEEYKINNGIN